MGHFDNLAHSWIGEATTLAAQEAQDGPSRGGPKPLRGSSGEAQPVRKYGGPGGRPGPLTRCREPGRPPGSPTRSPIFHAVENPSSA
jgi:hypothetical protein